VIKGLVLVLLALTIPSIHGADFEVQAYALDQPIGQAGAKGFYPAHDEYITRQISKAIDLGTKEIVNSPTVTFVKGDLIKFPLADSKSPDFKFVTDGYTVSVRLITETPDGSLETAISAERYHPQREPVKLQDGTDFNGTSLAHSGITTSVLIHPNTWVVLSTGKWSLIYRVKKV